MGTIAQLEQSVVYQATVELAVHQATVQLYVMK
jgi:hypothetical protein